MLPLGKRFAFLPGLGLGLYFGSSNRPLEVEENGSTSVVDEETSTFGVAATVYLTLGYQLSPNWHLRAGLALNALLGTESISSRDASLASSTAHVGLPIELHYAF